MKAVLRWVRISPKKANLIAWIVRWMWVWKAHDMLKFLDKKWAEIIKKLLISAIANAQKNFNQKKDDLILSKIYVTPWTTYKRWMSRSKWRVFKILKRTSHINIELMVKEIEPWSEVVDVAEDENVNEISEKATVKLEKKVVSKVKTWEKKSEKSEKVEKVNKKTKN